MWESLQNRFDNVATQVRRIQIKQKFVLSWTLPDENITQYFTRLIAFRKKLIGTTQQISEESLKTYIFTTLTHKYEITFQILELQIPLPTAQDVMTAVEEYAEWTALTNAISDAAISLAFYTYSGYCSCGSGCGHGCGGYGYGG